LAQFHRPVQLNDFAQLSSVFSTDARNGSWLSGPDVLQGQSQRAWVVQENAKKLNEARRNSPQIATGLGAV
jgi:hypothetical protein